MSSFPKVPQGYSTKTLPYKTTPSGHVLHLSIAYPFPSSSSSPPSPLRVVFYIHGGFLITGNRFAFFPFWLFNACTARNLVFVTPDYRLLPESTAHASVEDCVDAYKWMVQSLPSSIIDNPSPSDASIGSITLAGSSAGGYLALATAAAEEKGRKPDGLILIYGMLDPTDEWYLTKGKNSVFKIPLGAFDTKGIVEGSPHAGIGKKKKDEKSDDAITGDPSQNPRFPLINAVHVEGVFLDYLTGVDGMGERVKIEGVEKVVTREEDKKLFPLDFGSLGELLPRTFLLHGRNDSGVPWSLSRTAGDRIEGAGVKVTREFIDDAEHGFDTRAGDVDVEGMDEKGITPAFRGLKRAVGFLDDVVGGK